MKTSVSRKGFRLVLGVLLITLLPAQARTQPVPRPLSPALKVTRLNHNKPIITKELFLDVDPQLEYEAKNINGPCMVRIPDWVTREDRADPAAIYYLYFAHHGDAFIRMAWSTKVEGPYTLYNVHSKDRDDDGMPGRGVLDLGTHLGKSGKPEMRFNQDFRIKNNIASPDVLVDHVNKRFIMFFHGHSYKPNYDSRVANTSKQKTFVATSATGLNFNMPDGSEVKGGAGGGERGHGIRVGHLGNAYFRTFTYAGEMYAFTNYGPIWKSPSGTKPWDTSHLRDLNDDVWTEMPLKTQSPVKRNISNYRAAHSTKPIAGFTRSTTASPRHFATLMQENGHTLEVWYTARGDAPERIFRTTMDLRGKDWTKWRTQIHSVKDVHQEMLRPEYPWEGADLPAKGGQNGQTGFSNALRDPDLFRDADGKVYLFYVGGGESAIGVAQVHLVQ